MKNEFLTEIKRFVTKKRKIWWFNLRMFCPLKTHSYYLTAFQEYKNYSSKSFPLRSLYEFERSTIWNIFLVSLDSAQGQMH